MLAYSVLTRQRSTSDVGVELIASGADLPSNLNLEHLVGVARVEGTSSDLWAGLSYSHAQLQLRGRTQLVRRPTLPAPAAGGDRDRDRYGWVAFREHRHARRQLLDLPHPRETRRLLRKRFGQCRRHGTPSLHIAGSGEFGLNGAIVTSDTTALVATVQTDLSAKYKSPLSVGVGFGWQIGKTSINASGEWFDAIDPYVVMQGEEFTSQVPVEVRSFDVVQASDDVFNWAVGVGYSLTESIVGYGSFATDYAAVTDDVERADLSIAPVDVYSVFLGTEFEASRARVTLGAGYGWGSRAADRITDLIGDEEIEARYVFKRFRLLFGFELITN